MRTFNAVAAQRRTPRRIYCDNGSEFAGRLVDLWAYANQVTLEFSRPGKPTDNALIESFNGSLRDECLNVHWFRYLTDARPDGLKEGRKIADSVVDEMGSPQNGRQSWIYMIEDTCGRFFLTLGVHCSQGGERQ